MPTPEVDTTSPQPEDPGKKLLEQYKMPVDPDSHPPSDPEPEVETREEPVSPPPPKHPAWVSRAAKLAGLDDGELREMSTEDVKDAILLSKRQSDEHRDVQRDVRARDPRTGQFVAQPAPEPEKAFELADLGIDTSKWDENSSTADILKQVVEPLVKRVKQLESGLTDVDRRDQQRTAAQALDQIDKLFVQHESVFGKGGRDDLEPDSAEYTRRGMVIRAMQQNVASDPSLSFKKNFERAAKAFLTLTPTSPPPPAPVEDPKGFANGKTVVPTNRRFADMKPGIRKAELGIDEILRQMDEQEVTEKPVLPK